MQRCWLVAICWLVAGRADAQQEDSLRGALDAVTRRHRDLSAASGSPGSYYVDRAFHITPHPAEPLTFYEPQTVFQAGDGQPEDIGYGYQKSIAPHTAGVFDPAPVPSSELGVHETLANSHLPRITEKELERLASDYLGTVDGDNGRFVYKLPHSRLPPPSSKRSIFREREEGLSPEVLRRIYLADQESRPQLSPSDLDDVSQQLPVRVPSSFRERHPGWPGAVALVRSFGGLDRDEEVGAEGDDDKDEYLTVLNSVWEKYKAGAPEGSFDPEEMTESDVEELIDYLGEKEDRKRQDRYGGYDFFNSPMSWSKRSRQNLDSSPNDGFFHALKFLSSDPNVLESLHDEDLPTEDADEDVARLLMEQIPARQSPGGGRADGGRYGKRWNDIGGFDERFPYKGIAKRFPVTKRSPAYYSGPLNNKSTPNPPEHKHAKESGVESTDPKVARELDTIFSASGTGGKVQDGNKPAVDADGNGKEQHADNKTKPSEPEKLAKITHDAEKDGEKSDEKQRVQRKEKKDQGQKEETGESGEATKPLDVKKKSVDWSDYFGIDRRRKKSVDGDLNDVWLLDQYLKAYSIPGRHAADPSRTQQYENTVDTGPDYPLPQGVPDDIDSKLRAMEDLIVEEALKYTGAHEGVTDSREVKKVKDRVMSQLEAAYSLEKMRKALGEFKSSIAARKEAARPADNSTPKPESKEDQKLKRVAMKKEKADLQYKDKKLEKKSQDENEVNYVPSGILPHSSPDSHHIQREEELCPALRKISSRCRQISALLGDKHFMFLPLCTLHQVCNVCGLETGEGCDDSFLNQATVECQEISLPLCGLMARRALATVSSAPALPRENCAWENSPCLARAVNLYSDYRHR